MNRTMRADAPLHPSDSRDPLASRVELGLFALKLSDDAVADVLRQAREASDAGRLRPLDDPGAAPTGPEFVALVDDQPEAPDPFPIPGHVFEILIGRLQACQDVASLARTGADDFDVLNELVVVLTLEHQAVNWPRSSYALHERLNDVRRLVNQCWTRPVEILDEVVRVVVGPAVKDSRRWDIRILGGCA